MLRQLRSEKFRKILMIALAVIVIPSFVVVYGWQSGGPGPEAGPTPIAATIRQGPLQTREIGPPEMERGRQMLMMRMANYAQEQGYQVDQGVMARMVSSPKTVLDEAINVAILEEYARERGLAVSTDEARRYLEEQVPPAARETYIQMWKQQGRNLADVIESVRNDLLMDKVRSSLGSRVRVTLYEAWLAYALENTKLTLDSARFDSGRFLDKVEVTDPEIESYFEANRAKYRIPEQVEYAFVQVRKDDLRSSVTVTQDEMTSAYESMKEEFRLPRAAKVRTIFLEKPQTEQAAGATTQTEAVRARAQDVYSRVAKGENFASLADQLSELKDFPPREDAQTTVADLATTAGGNLGFVTEPVARNYYGDEWTSAVFTAAPGSVLPPIETPAGFHVVQVESIREGVLQPLDRVEEMVRRRVADQKVNPLFAEVGEKLAAADEKYPNLEQLARETGFPVQTTPRVERDAVFIPQIGLLGEFQLELADLRKGGRSQILSDENRHLIAEVREEFPEQDPPLDQVRERVVADFRQERARELARAAAERASKASTLEEFTTIATEAGSTPTKSNAFAVAEATTILGPVENFQEVAGTLKQGDIRMMTLGGQQMPMGYVVFHVSAKAEPSNKEFAEDISKVTNQLIARKQDVVLNEFLRDRRKALKDQIVVSEFYRD